jgi:hypothetical protein
MAGVAPEPARLCVCRWCDELQPPVAELPLPRAQTRNVLKKNWLQVPVLRTSRTMTAKLLVEPTLNRHPQVPHPMCRGSQRSQEAYIICVTTIKPFSARQAQRI